MIWPDGSRYSFENVIKDDAHCIKWNLLTRPEMPLLLWADLFHSFNFSTPSYGDEIMPNLMYIVNSYLICRTTFSTLLPVLINLLHFTEEKFYCSVFTTQIKQFYC